MIFPEGTRMPPGETRRYGLSGTLLAQAAGRLLVPVAHNAGDFWPRRGLAQAPGTVRFCIGRPVDPAGRDAREVTEEIQRWVEAKVAELRASKPLAAMPDQTSRFATVSALRSMKSRRGSTWSPISVVKISSAATASSIRTCISRRVCGLTVVSHSCSGFISPRPL